MTTRLPEIAGRAEMPLRRPPRPGPIDSQAVARFHAVLGDLPLDIGTLPDQRAVWDALGSLTLAAARCYEQPW